MAFFISRGFVKTGLGRRIALQFVKLFGKKTLGLAYSLVGVDLILALLLQVIQHVLVVLCFQSLSPCQSHLVHRRKMALRENGCILIFTEFQGNLITSAMFLTAMAGNPIAQSLAEKRHTFK